MPGPTQIGAAPDLPQRNDEDTFSDREDAFIDWEANDLRPNANAIANEVNLANAQAQAAAAVASNANLAAGTSTTNYTPAVTGVGANFVYVEAARSPQLGARLRVADQANPTTNFAEGVCTAFNAGTNTVTIVMDRIGTIPAASALWRVFQVGAPGVDGSNASVLSPTRAVTTSGSVTIADAGFEIDVTAAGVTLTADTAATLGDGFSCIINAVGVPVTVSGTFNTGRTTVVIPANYSALLSSNGATHRVQLLPEIASAYGTPGTAVVAQSVAAAGTLSICAMTTTRGFVAYKVSSATIGVALIDNTGAVLATANLATTLANVGHCQLVAIDASRAIAVYEDATGPRGCEAVVVSFAGTVITVGAASTLEASCTKPSVCMLPGTSKAVACWGKVTTGLRAAVVTIGAGTAITSVGAIATGFAGTTPQMSRVAAVSATQVVAMYMHSGSTVVSAIPFTESGGALTPASAATQLDTQMTNTNTFDIVTGNSTQPRAVAIQSVGGIGRAQTVDVSGTGASAKLLVGPQAPVLHINVTGAYATRLAKVSNDTYACITVGSDTNSTIHAGVLTARDNGMELEAGGINIARAGAQLGLEAAVFGNSLLVAYADGDNSGFSTVKAVPLNSVV